jgi:hypothetical protein
MYWMRSEGLAEAATTDNIAGFLAVPAVTLQPFLERFVADGYLASGPEGYRLTATGVEAGMRSFADEFADLTRPTHGECDADCWCHSSPEEAARCLDERVGHLD